MAETQHRHVIITTKDGASPPTVLYLSDFIKTSYSEIILTWGSIQSVKIDPITYSTQPGQCSFVVANNIAIGGQTRFAKVPGLVFADISIYQNDVLIFWGTIEDLTNIGNSNVSVQCITKDAELSKLFPSTIINTTTFTNAEMTDIGKMLPVVYGAAKRVPFMGIDVGASSRLIWTITSPTTLILVSDASKFPASGVLEVDSEYISYSSITGNDITITTRGYNNTTIADHDISAIVSEVKTEHLYAIEGTVSDIGDIYVGGVLLNEDPLPRRVSVTRYESGHPTFPNQSCIGISFSQTISGNQNFDAVVAEEVYKVAPEVAVTPIVKPIDSTDADSAAWDGGLATYYDSAADGYTLTQVAYPGGFDPQRRYVAFKFAKAPDGYNLRLHLCLHTGFAGNAATAVQVDASANTNGPLADWFPGDPVGDELYSNPDSFYVAIVDPSGACPLWLTLEMGNSFGTYDGWIFIIWPDAESSDLRVYEVHAEYYMLDPTEQTCPEPCPYCTTPVSASGLVGTAGGAASIGTIPRGDAFIKQNSNTPATSFGWDRVYADVTGIASGITTPEAIIQDIITQKCGLSVSLSHATTGYTEGVVITQSPDVRALLHRIATQAKCISFFTPTHHVLKQMTGTYSTTAIINSADVFEKQAWVNYTNKSYIANALDSLYNYYWWGMAGGSDIVTAEDSTSQDTYGVAALSENYPYIAGSVQAQAVLDWRLADLKEPRLMVEFMGTLTNNINRKIGDVVRFGVSDSDLDNLLAGMVSGTDDFLIIEIVFQADGVIRIATIKV